MPSAPLRPCLEPGCPALVPHGRCITHAQHAPSRVPRARPNAEVRKLYATVRWFAYRRQVLSRQPLCVVCQEEGRTTMATEVDHYIPHRGNLTLFWDYLNLQALCHYHHGQKTGRGA
jgi:5-methylcytosine-specific restriction protein A